MPIFTPHPLRDLAMLALIAVTSSAMAHDGQDHTGMSGPSSAEAPFLSENDAAMAKMMAGMDTKPTGDIDRDFVAMMSPHHQGAIDMAMTLLKYGHNEQLKRLAQEIIVEQQQEIAAMQLAIGAPLPPSTAAPTQIPAQISSATQP
ncbi:MULTISPECIES: DUF305 domain-containing protein [Pseudomonas]|uniref:DUF305 domain-containing protein n=1 Tax=Pseudomonas TaxID=286 RepID=UPI0015A3D175|nr:MULTISPECIES: DUF305 domain-containing protein [Pseudomonas]NVZ60658.1 DUF305 domain-containing protein [Pseudomonas gingeri]NVZ76803.1 DUF305 domain-containing protein [Pseudomonas gingeri]NWE26478.1 DUF305 domain-containing protein [Pseudomonas gingeri]NWE97393.1 DUF305 domain-containing protein [Pseudomonas gingeri]BBP77285.1 hypothetical protein PHLH7_33890 [Pseudomonas sp. Ost2]